MFSLDTVGQIEYREFIIVIHDSEPLPIMRGRPNVNSLWKAVFPDQLAIRVRLYELNGQDFRFLRILLLVGTRRFLHHSYFIEKSVAASFNLCERCIQR